MNELERGGGLRFNEGKLRYDLVHAWSHEQMVKILTKGSLKYSARNWEKGMVWSNVISSLKRHLAAIENGEDYDKETGELHAAHIQCNAHFLTAYYKIYPQGDDRNHRYLNPVRIALDIDDVLADFVGEWAIYHKCNIPEAWTFDRDIAGKFEKMKAEGRMEEFYMNIHPKVSPADIPFEPYCYVTARSVDSKITEAWLDKFGFPAAPVHTLGPGTSKLQVLKDNKIEIFVDDRYDTFVELNNNGVCCFLMDAGHNRRYDVGYRRIHHLKDLL